MVPDIRCAPCISVGVSANRARQIERRPSRREILARETKSQTLQRHQSTRRLNPHTRGCQSNYPVDPRVQTHLKRSDSIKLAAKILERRADFKRDAPTHELNLLQASPAHPCLKITGTLQQMLLHSQCKHKPQEPHVSAPGSPNSAARHRTGLLRRRLPPEREGCRSLASRLGDQGKWQSAGSGGASQMMLCLKQIVPVTSSVH